VNCTHGRIWPPRTPPGPSPGEERRPSTDSRAWLQVTHWHIPVVVTIPRVVIPGQAQAARPVRGSTLLSYPPFGAPLVDRSLGLPCNLTVSPVLTPRFARSSPLVRRSESGCAGPPARSVLAPCQEVRAEPRWVSRFARSSPLVRRSESGCAESPARSVVLAPCQEVRAEPRWDEPTRRPSPGACEER